MVFADHMEIVMKMMTLNPAPLFFMVKVWNLQVISLLRWSRVRFFKDQILLLLICNGHPAKMTLLVHGIPLIVLN